MTISLVPLVRFSYTSPWTDTSISSRSPLSSHKDVSCLHRFDKLKHLSPSHWYYHSPWCLPAPSTFPSISIFINTLAFYYVIVCTSTPEYKCTWAYIFSVCPNAGVWQKKYTRNFMWNFARASMLLSKIFVFFQTSNYPNNNRLFCD